MKTLLLDIETAPSKGYIWSLWSEVRSTEFLESHWYILCWCAKWLNDKKFYCESLPKYNLYKINPDNDIEILKPLWKLLNEADIVICHNGNKFDRRKINTRFLYNKITPPSPYKMIDTLQSARNIFAFTSNRLNDLGQFLGVGGKIETHGFKLWRGCLNKDKKSWDLMVKYCRRDVQLLEYIYLKLRPYIFNHPNVTLDNIKSNSSCPKCGSSKLVKEGFVYTYSSKYQRFSCKDCGGWGRENKNLIDKTIKSRVTKNII